MVVVPVGKDGQIYLFQMDAQCAGIMRKQFGLTHIEQQLTTVV